MSKEVKEFTVTYCVLVWNKLFEIYTLSVSDPVKAYEMLVNLIPLLPEKVKKEVKPLIKSFEKKVLAEKEIIIHEYNYDLITAKLVFAKHVRGEIKKIVRKILDKISSEMEVMGLKYQYERI